MLRLSRGDRAGGIIKGSAEDFVVEEITPNGIALEKDKKYSASELGMVDEEGKFTIFIMQKRNWNTSQALKALARLFRRGVKSTSFAGTKDRIAISTQLCSMFGVWPDQLLNAHLKDITINGAWEGKEKIKMGGLLGNRFSITVRDSSNYENIGRIAEELGGVFPNYYGEQRFGYRKTNFDTGLDILKGDFEAAAMHFLTDTQNESMEDARLARDRLANELDFKSALNYFPGYLKYERSMIEYLAKYPKNYANAIRSLARSISLMFVHSVEAQIFNMELDERVRDGSTEPNPTDTVCYADGYGFPDLSKLGNFDRDDKKGAFPVGNIIGYDTARLTDFESNMLEELGLTIDSFKAEGLQELQSKGTSRVLFAPFKDLGSASLDENAFRLTFSLAAGSYATILLDELVETKTQRPERPNRKSI